jgi:aldehyde:ferredoxin oxidoreductase
MQLNGFGQGIAHIDLSGGSVELRPVPEEWVRKFVGGRGLGVRYLLENGPEVEPLSPENLLCFMNGPLSGSDANMSGRWACVTKSPLTGTVTDSHQGGWSGARLRWAGFDGLVFRGRAERPVYAFVEDGEVSLRDASEVWGKGVHETVAFFRERYGAKDLSVCAIGQAGEKLNLYAAWINEDDRAFGRGGTGTVGGYKQLKAIVIRAARSKSQVPDAERWKQVRKQTLDILRDESKITSPKKGGLSVYGTNLLMNVVSNIGALGTNNSRETSFGERAEKISGEYVQQNILVNDPTCHACPVACKKEVEIKEGPYAGLRMESVEYEPAWSLGANCGNDDIASIARMIDDCNDYGIDPIELGNAFSMYMEATERGWVQGDGLRWGDHASMVAMIEAIALRQGEVGDLLADGPARAAEKLGHPEIAMTVKGQALAAYDPRGLKGMGLGYATSNRGACHLRGYVAAAELGVLPMDADPLEWKGKGELVRLFQDIAAFSDSLDLCKFSAFAEGPDEYAAQYAAAMGIEFTAADVLAAGERIYNLERHYNNLAGFREGSDTLPRRFLEEASTLAGSKGHVSELGPMLEEYYAARGWQDGVVPESKLKELGIP